MNVQTQKPSVPDATVFLVDDEREVRSALSRALELRGYAVQAFPSATEFLEAYVPDSAGCLVLDYGMPGMNGLELQQEMNARKIKLPIVFISGHGGVPESVQAMKGGAIDFIQKPFRQSVLLDCINNAFEADSNMRVKVQTEAQTRSKFERLTSRELEIAEFIVANPSYTTSKHIGRELNISPRTVDHHRARILEKLEINSVAELINLSHFFESDQQS